MEKIKIPEIIFKYSWIYDQNWKAVGERLSMEIEHLSQEDIRGYMKKVEKSWKENERDILEELSKITSLSWKSESITCYVVKRCFMPSAFSDPLTISVLTHKKEDEFVDVLTHELIHRLLTEPGRMKELEDHKKLKEEKYPEESFKTKIHITVHAIHKHVYLKFFNKDRLKRDMEKMRRIEDYRRAWDIVEREGHEKIIEDLRESIK